jgi:hypothetical protein
MLTDQSIMEIDRVRVKKEYRENFEGNKIRETIMKVIGINVSSRLVDFSVRI